MWATEARRGLGHGLAKGVRSLSTIRLQSRLPRNMAFLIGSCSKGPFPFAELSVAIAEGWPASESTKACFQCP